MLNRLACALATPAGFAASMATLIIGNVIGFALGWSDTWMLIFNLYISQATMVLGQIILVAQRRDTEAMQAKLDELVATSEARNELIRAEDKTEPEIEAMRR